MGHEMVVNRVKIGARILRILTQISFWAAITAGGLALIIGILLKAFPEAFSQGLLGVFGRGVVSGTMDMLTIDLSGLTFREILLVNETILFGFIVSCVMGALFLLQLAGLLRVVEKGRPFSPDCAKNLTAMGVIVIVSSVAAQIGKYVVLYTIMEITGLSDVSVNYFPDSNMILIGILLFILAGIFKYGSYLQDEYDATL